MSFNPVFNPLPLMLAPGVCICGYLLDEWFGLGAAAAGWASLMVLSTAINAIFCRRDSKRRSTLICADRRVNGAGRVARRHPAETSQLDPIGPLQFQRGRASVTFGKHQQAAATRRGIL